ncbi:hypothetical protein IHV10_02345 [Fictibacillus sp. 5RED26]|nr:hypothetical protein [Fictibacillus sp. 5RED26]
MTELIRLAIIFVLTTQGGYFLAIFLAGHSMIEWYEWSIIPNPNKNIFISITNGFTASFIGIAYQAGKRVDHHNLFLKRVYLLGYAMLFIIASVTFYQTVDYF